MYNNLRYRTGSIIVAYMEDVRAESEDNIPGFRIAEIKKKCTLHEFNSLEEILPREFTRRIYKVF